MMKFFVALGAIVVLIGGYTAYTIVRRSHPPDPRRESFRGVAIPFTKSMLTKTIEPQFIAMNNALAARATKMSAA
jgi:hypothetical protein